jgi:hypothetical protein
MPRTPATWGLAAAPQARQRCGMGELGIWQLDSGERAERVEESTALLEKRLEDWIHEDPSMLDGDIEWVARQLVLPGGKRLDLLGLAPDDAWVVVELKAGRVGADTVSQALTYVLALDQLSNAELAAKIKKQNPSNGSISDRLHAMSEASEEEPERIYRILVAGIGSAEEAQRAAESLGRLSLDVEITTVSFRAFTTPQGHLLVRELEEDPEPEVSAGSSWTLAALLHRAAGNGVEAEFQRALSEMTDRGYGTRQKKFGLLFNRHSRRQVFWFGMYRGSIQVGFHERNFPDVFGVTRLQAIELLGANWRELPPAAAVDCLIGWADKVTDAGWALEQDSGSES